MKTLLLFVLTAALVHGAQPAEKHALPSAIITSDTKLELTKTKGSIVLPAGSKVDVIGQEGDSLSVMYRNLPGLVPRAKTNFKGDVPKTTSTAPALEVKVSPAPVVTPSAAAMPPPAKPSEAKPAAATATTPSPAPREPVTNYGKAVKKARDVTGAHKDSMVDPTNEITGGAKKE